MAGFTLLEILVATTLFIVVLALIMGVLNNSTTIATQATKQMDANRVARECMDLMGREISMATAPLDPQRVLNNSAPSSFSSLQLSVSGSFGILPTTTPTLSYTNPDYIFWQAPVARNRTYGNQAIVGYFVLRDTQDADRSKWRMQLRRVSVDPEDPANIVNYKIYSSPTILKDSYATSTSWSSSILPLFAPNTATADNSNAQSGWVADGVFGLWIRCLDKYGNAIANRGTGGGNTKYTGARYESRDGYSQASGTINYPTALPSYVEVALGCMAPSEVSRITSPVTTGSTVPTNFLPALDNSQAPLGYIQNFRKANPNVKSAGIYVRRFRIYGGD